MRALVVISMAPRGYGAPARERGAASSNDEREGQARPGHAGLRAAVDLSNGNAFAKKVSKKAIYIRRIL